MANFYSSQGIKYVHSFLSKGRIALASKKEAFLCVLTAVPFDYGTLFSFRDDVLALLYLLKKCKVNVEKYGFKFIYLT